MSVATRWQARRPAYAELSPEARTRVDRVVATMVERGWSAYQARAWVMVRVRTYTATGGTGTGH